VSETLPTAAVVIATYNRPDHLRTCLEHLQRQSVPADQIVVVDASPGPASRAVAESFPGVVYLRNLKGAGSTATSRAIGVGYVTTDVVGFVDDDAYADPEWLHQTLLRYADPNVGAVGGRALNGQPDEEHEGVDEIGRFRSNGTLTGFFAADPGRDLDVDHLLGANMSVRRSTVLELGGIRDLYPGTCLREETDVVLRMREAGRRVVYTPAAVVRHVAGPYAKGRRFDLRYTFYSQRNHFALLASTVGVRDPRFRRFVGVSLGAAGHEIDYARKALSRRGDEGSVLRGVGNGLTRAVVSFAGTVAGLGVAASLSRRYAHPRTLQELPKATAGTPA
jgi:GT2 family glycosyltransferase